MKNNNLLYEIRKRFLLEEGVITPSVGGYIQSLVDVLNMFSPRSMMDTRRLEVAKENLIALEE